MKSSKFVATRWIREARGLVVVLPPIAVILSVLGSFMGGIAAPTEAASMGGVGSILALWLPRAIGW